MEIEMDTPEDRKPRWMNDTDLNKPLVLVSVMKLENGQRELVFQTQLLESIRRTTYVTSTEYAFIYNNVTNGNKVFKYRKNAQGFRMPEIV